MTEKELQGIQTKETIIREATLLFQEHGYRGTPLSAIAKKAGIRVSTILYHFESKANLFVQVFNRYFSQGENIYTKYLKMDGSPLQRIRGIVQERLRQDPMGEALTLACWEFRLMEKESMVQLKQQYYIGYGSKVFASPYQEGIEAGELKPLDADMWGELLTSLVSNWYSMKSGYDAQENFLKQFEFFLGNYKI